MALGHEVFGVIAEVGANVSVDTYVVGQRAVVNPMTSDGSSARAVGRARSVIACSCEMCAPIRSCLSLRNVPDEVAVLTEPLAVARHAVNKAVAAPDARVVVVLGAGMIGLGVVLWLRRSGVSNIVAVGVAAMRLDIARRLGASATVLADGTPLMERLTEELGGAVVMGMPVVDADIWIDVAGSADAFAEIVTMAKKHALIVGVGSHKVPVLVDLRRMLMSETTLVMAMGYPVELAQTLADLADVATEVAPLVTHRTPIRSFQDGLDAISGPATVACGCSWRTDACLKSVITLREE